LRRIPAIRLNHVLDAKQEEVEHGGEQAVVLFPIAREEVHAMSNRRKMMLLIQCGAVLIVGAFFFGCEDADDSNLEDTNASFTVQPANITLTASNTTAVFMAVGGHAPLTWSVSDQSLGSISGSGQTVTYTRSDLNGVNRIEVRDGLGWIAHAVVQQIPNPAERPDDEDLSLSPQSATLYNDGDKIVISAVGGDDPYDWDVGDGTRGKIEPQGDFQVIYTRLSSGNNTVICTDHDGRVSIAQISQPAAATLGISPVNTTISTNGGSAVFTAAGGNGVYTWGIQSGPGSMNPGTGNSSVLTVPAGTTPTIVQVSDGASVVFATVNRQ